MKGSIKIHILLDFVDEGWGGGNQFLKAIREYFLDNNVYVDDYNNADVIILNSHHNYKKALKIKRKNSNVMFIHRLDGPISYYREDGKFLDKIIFKINKILANGTIFQSHYSRKSSIDKGLILNHQLDKIIINAPSNAIFFNKENRKINDKVKLIATSWSGNWKKGFDVYKWLDENLDFNKYEMVFVGNSPIKFKNIIYKKPMNSIELANELRNSDIFIFASKVESCSNSLLEALHCGLPVIAYDSSSMPELVLDNGELFRNKAEIPSLLEKIINKYTEYSACTKLPKIRDIGESYFLFSKKIFKQQNRKKLNIINYYFTIKYIDTLVLAKKIILKLKKGQ